jgi:YfiH family protein
MFFEKCEKLFFGRFAGLYGKYEITHAFSTRNGGVSQPPFDTLNLGYNTEDLAESPKENRKLFFQYLGISENTLAIPMQVHGDQIRKVDNPGQYPSTDALITRNSNVTLIVQVADCVPVYLYDPVQRAAGLVHAGWRGSALQITLKTVKEMTLQFGSKTEDILAFIGPSIGPCCYEVGSEVIHQFPEQFVKQKRLDLWQVNKSQLMDAGLLYNHIDMALLCTVCHTEFFFSHRASGDKTGRMMAILKVNDKIT